MNMGQILLVLLGIAVLSIGDLPEEPQRHGIGLTVRVERGDVISRVTVSVSNATDHAFTFRTGSYGGAGSLDDGFRVPAAKDAPRPGAPRGPRPVARACHHRHRAHGRPGTPVRPRRGKRGHAAGTVIRRPHPSLHAATRDHHTAGRRADVRELRGSDDPLGT